MSTVVSVHRQDLNAHTSPKSAPHKAPMALAGRLLRQFEQDLKAGDNQRAQLVNEVLLELQRLMSPTQAEKVDREIADAWRRACGWDF